MVICTPRPHGLGSHFGQLWRPPGLQRVTYHPGPEQRRTGLQRRRRPFGAAARLLHRLARGGRRAGRAYGRIPADLVRRVWLAARLRRPEGAGRARRIPGHGRFGPAGPLRRRDPRHRRARPGNHSLTWTATGKPAPDTAAGGSAIYAYDASGHKLIQRDPAITTLFLDDEQIVLNNSTKALTGTRYYTFNGVTIAVRSGGAAASYLFADRQGTGDLAITTTTGNAVACRQYLPFGEVRGAAPNNWPGGDRGYVGGPDDANTGLETLGARQYDAGIGRFLSRDPILGPAHPNQLGGYVYAGNDPVTLSDPSGLRAIDPDYQDQFGRDLGYGKAQKPFPKRVDPQPKDYKKFIDYLEAKNGEKPIRRGTILGAATVYDKNGVLKAFDDTFRSGGGFAFDETSRSQKHIETRHQMVRRTGSASARRHIGHRRVRGRKAHVHQQLRSGRPSSGHQRWHQSQYISHGEDLTPDELKRPIDFDTSNAAKAPRHPMDPPPNAPNPDTLPGPGRVQPRPVHRNPERGARHLLAGPLRSQRLFAEQERRIPAGQFGWPRLRREPGIRRRRPVRRCRRAHRRRRAARLLIHSRPPGGRERYENGRPYAMGSSGSSGALGFLGG